MSSPGDEEARALCASKLTALKILSDAQNEPFLWGGQKAGKGYRLDDSDTTRFNAFVWRRMYLSLFMFTGEVRLETVGDFTVIHLPYQFRNQLDIGSYPYPFWHSKAKWDSWQLSPELAIVMEKAPPQRAPSARQCARTGPTTSASGAGNGSGRRAITTCRTCRSTASSSRPRTRTSRASRPPTARCPARCGARPASVCHAPDNFAKVAQLEFFNYPNQALYSRHSIVMHLDCNTMPPKNDYGLPIGIMDEGERLSCSASPRSSRRRATTPSPSRASCGRGRRPPRPTAGRSGAAPPRDHFSVATYTPFQPGGGGLAARARQRSASTRLGGLLASADSSASASPKRRSK